MDILTQIKHRLADFPTVVYEAQPGSLRILPNSETGFTVSLHTNGGSYTVSFNGWHEEFTDAQEALDCFGFGLSPACRLIEYRRGRTACRWSAQTFRDGEWRDFSVTGLTIVPFWQREIPEILQNHLFPPQGNEVPAR